MARKTKIIVVATIIVICVLFLMACNSAEKTSDTDKPFDERVIEVALDELDKTSERKELIFLFAEGEYSE